MWVGTELDKATNQFKVLPKVLTIGYVDEDFIISLG